MGSGGGNYYICFITQQYQTSGATWLISSQSPTCITQCRSLTKSPKFDFCYQPQWFLLSKKLFLSIKKLFVKSPLDSLSYWNIYEWKGITWSEICFKKIQFGTKGRIWQKGSKFYCLMLVIWVIVQCSLLLIIFWHFQNMKLKVNLRWWIVKF
jgi:hypothetical protein